MCWLDARFLPSHSILKLITLRNPPLSKRKKKKKSTYSYTNTNMYYRISLSMCYYLNLQSLCYMDCLNFNIRWIIGKPSCQMNNHYSLVTTSWWWLLKGTLYIMTWNCGMELGPSSRHLYDSNSRHIGWTGLMCTAIELWVGYTIFLWGFLMAFSSPHLDIVVGLGYQQLYWVSQ